MHRASDHWVFSLLIAIHYKLMKSWYSYTYSYFNMYVPINPSLLPPLLVEGLSVDLELGQYHLKLVMHYK